MIDFVYGEPHYAHHLWPIYEALFILDMSGRWLSYEQAEVQGGPQLGNVLVASYRDVKRVRALGAKRIALIQHGAGQSYGGTIHRNTHPSYSGGGDHHDVSLFLCPNTISADRWTATYPDAAVRVVGSPRVEALPLREGGGDATVALSWHWQCTLCPETQTAFGHYRRAIPELLRYHRVIGHAHPRARRWIAPYYKQLGIPFIDDFEEVSKQADLYVCDNSSTIYEFAATGRPVVLLNAPWYRRHVEHGLRFWELATVGVQVDEPEGLVDGVSCGLVDPRGIKEERRRVSGIVYGEVAGSTRRAVAALREWIGE